LNAIELSSIAIAEGYIVAFKIKDKSLSAAYEFIQVSRSNRQKRDRGQFADGHLA